MLCRAKLLQSHPTLCDPMDCSPPGSSVHWVSQARILEWVAISFSRGSSQFRNQTHVSCIACRFFTDWTTREAALYSLVISIWVWISLKNSLNWATPSSGVYGCFWHPTPVLLAGKSNGQRSLVGCSPWGRWVRHDWATSLSLFTFMHWRGKWQPTPVFLPGESQGRGSFVGCHLSGRTESNTTEATQQ